MTPRTAHRIAGIAGIAVAALIAAAGLGAAAAPASAATADACTRTLPAGASSIPVPFGGATYAVPVHVPAGATGELPLVLDLHGSNANGTVQAQISGLAAVADAEGFIVANPSGAIGAPAFAQTLPDGNWGWNVPGVPLTSGTFPPDGSRDDVAFLTAVVEAIDAQGCVAEGSVFATGFSGGGRMASALACSRADVFAAVAPVAGLRAGRADPAALATIEAGSCAPTRPVAVLSFHGTADVVNPYPGNADPRWGYSVAAAAAGWAALDGCDATPTSTTATATATRIAFAGCAEGGAVEYYELAGGGHTWPGTTVDLSALGATDASVSASALMWDFFEANARTAAAEEPPVASPAPSAPAAPPSAEQAPRELAATGPASVLAAISLAIGLALIGASAVGAARRRRA
ncbi:alpha/beta hydrolase family esterase [Arenivirga flava]|uniref:alpha/beta hydrolase family esterase n=1 Tax=Arenivirga flava TaxID=1930060 RepID=UPI0024E102ED|nr:PHB depolymerase family esterase [Arenivirga flava]